MKERVFAALGVDYVQWLALTRTYLRIDVRRSGAPRRRKEKQRHGFWAYAGLLLITLLQSGVLAGVAVVIQDAFTATVFLTTFAALNSGLLLMADFAGFVVSPDDYWIVGSRPVSPRTYFAARLTSVLAHVTMIATVLAVLPSATLGFRHSLGIAGAAAAFVATFLCALSAAVVTIAGYTALMMRVRPERLSRTVGYLQLISTMTFLGGYAFIVRAVDDARLRQISARDVDWIWVAPPVWFASLVTSATGSGDTRDWVALAAAIVLTAVCAPLATGRLSLDYAAHLSEAASSRSGETRAPRPVRIPGFRRGEANAVATLIRAQFRNDMRFRMAILAILPLTVFYLVMGAESISDPFVEGPAGGGVPLYFAVVFMPMTLHGALRFSDSWRAAWIFFATPADPAKLIVAAKNFVAMFFLGSYVLLLATLASFYYARVWHAFVHMAIVGAIAHLLLQAAVMLAPELPFATEPRKADRSSQLFGLMMFGSAAGAAIPLALPFVYESGLATIILIVLLIAATVGLELLLRARARAAILAMEAGS